MILIYSFIFMFIHEYQSTWNLTRVKLKLYQKRRRIIVSFQSNLSDNFQTPFIQMSSNDFFSWIISTSSHFFFNWLFSFSSFFFFFLSSLSSFSFFFFVTFPFCQGVAKFGSKNVFLFDFILLCCFYLSALDRYFFLLPMISPDIKKEESSTLRLNKVFA